MLNSSENVFTGSLGTRQTPPCEITHGLGHGCTQMHTRRRTVKDARCFIMSNCSGVVIFKMGVRHVFVLPNLISAPFSLDSDYLGVSTSNLIGE